MGYFNKAVLITGAMSSLMWLAVASAVPVSAESTNAALMRCSSHSRKATVDCCNTVLRKHKRPYWMGQGVSCSKVVACSGPAKGPQLMEVGKVQPMKKVVLCHIEMKPVSKDLDGAKPVKGRSFSSFN